MTLQEKFQQIRDLDEVCRSWELRIARWMDERDALIRSLGLAPDVIERETGVRPSAD